MSAPDDRNPLQQIFDAFAEQLNDAPGAARLARTAKFIPGALIDEVATLILRINDVQLIGNDLSAHLFDVGYCSSKYVDAAQFAAALRRRLETYLDAEEARYARLHFQERVAWFRMAISRAGKLSKWPALVLTETCKKG